MVCKTMLETPEAPTTLPIISNEILGIFKQYLCTLVIILLHFHSPIQYPQQIQKHVALLEGFHNKVMFALPVEQQLVKMPKKISIPVYDLKPIEIFVYNVSRILVATSYSWCISYFCSLATCKIPSSSAKMS